MTVDPKHVHSDPAVRALIQQKARNLARRIPDPAKSVEDYESHFFEQILSRLQGYDPGRGNPVGLAIVIVLHAWFDLIRASKAAKRRRPRPLTDVLKDKLDDDARRPERSRDLQDLAMDVEAILPHLPPDLRRLMVALMESGTIAGAARLLGKPRTTIYSGLARLRRICEDKGLLDYL
jgi:RNA polymerase sigma factor (sigma-70 family)